MAELTEKRKEAEKTRSSVKIEEEMASNAATEAKVFCLVD